MFKLSPENLFKIGYPAFALIGICKVINLIIIWEGINFFVRTYSLLDVLFSFSLAFTFNYLASENELNKDLDNFDIHQEDINKALKKLK